MTDSIPYTHWAYFSDRAAADACAKELAPSRPHTPPTGARTA